MTADRIICLCYVAVVGVLVGVNYPNGWGLLFLVAVVSVSNLIGFIFGKDTQ